jgi:hypothetical protein
MRRPFREAALAMTAATLVVVWPLLLPVVYDTHDGHYAMYNAAQFDVALRDGQFPVRWLPDLFGGRGLPHFLYYHPLAFYLVSLLHAVGLGFMASLRLLQALALLVAGLGAWAWLRRHVPPPAAVVGGMGCILAPFTVVEVHVKGDPAAVLALALVPLVLLALARVADQRPGGVPLLALASAGLVLAHSVTALVVAPLLVVAAVAAVVLPWRPLVARRVAAGTIWGALLSIFHWLPALAERNLVRVDSREGILFFDFHDHFLAPWQWLSPLWGYHGSFAGTSDDMAFQVGPVHATALVAGLLFLRRFPAAGLRRPAAAALALAGGALLLTLHPSLPLWEAIGPLRYVQFPWRWLVVVTLASSLAMAVLLATAATGRRLVPAVCVLPALLAAFFGLIQGNGFYGMVAVWCAAAGMTTFLIWRRPEAGSGNAWAVAVMLMAVALPWSAVPLHARIKGEPAVIPLREKDLRPERVRLGLRRTAARDDYLPRTVQVVPARDASQEFLPPPGAAPPVSVQVLAGQATVTDLHRFSDGLAFAVAAGGPCRLRLNLHDFAGMTATLTTTAGSRMVPHERDDAGRVMLDLPAGEERLEVRLRRTPVRRLADGLALLGWLLLPAAQFFNWSRALVVSMSTRATPSAAGAGITHSTSASSPTRRA